jgi:hypothetical protein
MSTVAEIKEAISHLPETDRQEIAIWVQSICSGGKRRLTDDGFDIEETKAKLQKAANGTFCKWTDDDWQRLHDSVK